MQCKFLQVLFVVICSGAAAQVNSGSNGSDGAFSPSTNTVINLADHPNGIYQYSSINISNGVTVTFIPNINNTPVVWLVQSNCVINGTVDVSGQDGNGTAAGRGGPGGWRGGDGGSNPSSGQGPGGGSAAVGGSQNLSGHASFATLGDRSGPSCAGFNGQAAPGATYGNIYALPLLGGSGGGGHFTGGAGGGAGSILIAANDSIAIGGNIFANGGNGSGGGGAGGGSGGAIRLVAPVISGNGTLRAAGGNGFAGWSCSGAGNMINYAGTGPIRLDTFQNAFGGTIGTPFTQGFQPIIIPTSGQGVQLNIISVGGVAVSNSPTGQLLTPDAVVAGQQLNPISVMVRCTNLPLNTAVTVTVKPATGPPVSAIGYNNSGTPASSTATISLNMPRGGGIIYASAATGN